MNSEITTVRLLADYECHPLWLTGDRAGDVAPDSPDMGLTPSLAEKLDAWAGRFDATLVMDDPRLSGFPTEEAEHAFAQDGETLARQLAVELGPGWRVVYNDPRIGADVEVPAS
ncbi:hypothetical protein [Streptomyces sp. NPDC055005]